MSTDDDIETRHWSTHAIKGPHAITARLSEEDPSVVEMTMKDAAAERAVLHLTAREWAALRELCWRILPETPPEPKAEAEPDTILTGQGRTLLAESLTAKAKNDGIEGGSLTVASWPEKHKPVNVLSPAVGVVVSRPDSPHEISTTNGRS